MNNKNLAIMTYTHGGVFAFMSGVALYLCNVSTQELASFGSIENLEAAAWGLNALSSGFVSVASAGLSYFKTNEGTNYLLEHKENLKENNLEQTLREE